MSVLARVLGANWRCDRCGTAYYRAPRRCRRCGSTVYSRVH